MDSQYGDRSFTDLLQEGESNLVNEFLMGTQTSTISSTKKSRGKHLSHEEDLIIVKAWLNTSLDGIVGTDQKNKKFWSRIHAYYHECKKPNHQERSSHSLSNRWSIIQCSVNKFCGCLTQIENSNLSGYSEENKFKMAKVNYKDDNDVDFLFDHCWEILKLQPKWILKNQELNTKKKKATKSTHVVHYGSPSAPVDIGDEIGFSAKSDFPKRPPGRKAKKCNEKRRKYNEAKSTRLEEIVTKLGEERKHLHDEKMAKINLIAQIEEKKVRQKERLVTIAERRLEQEEQEKIDKIMMMDISGLHEVQQDYIKKRCMEIVQNMKTN